MLRSVTLFYAIAIAQAFAPVQRPSISTTWTQLYANSENFESLTVPELKDELKSRGLKVGGNKSELVERLMLQEVLNEETVDVTAELVESDEDLVENESQDIATSETRTTTISVSEDASFDELGIMPQLLASIESQQWDDPTPIQRLTIPAILNEFKADSDNCSLWAEAPTGSGKTGAFAIPMIQLTLANRKIDRNRMMQRDSYEENTSQRNVGRARRKQGDDGVQSKGFVTTLILVPTRELAMQIGGVIEELIEGMPSSGKDKDNVDVMVITGGTRMEPQVEMLAERKLNNRNLDILVATPGRLADVLLRSEKEDSVDKELEKRLLLALDQFGGKNTKNEASLSLAQLEDLNINKAIASGDDGGRSAIKDMLSNVRYLVIDEADRLLSPGFKSEMDEILNLLPKPNTVLKTLLFSATFPEQIQPRVQQVLRRLSGKGAPAPLRLACSYAGFAQVGGELLLSNTQLKRKERISQPQAILEGPASTIDLRTIRIDDQDRTQALRRLIREYGDSEWDRVLVFVATRYAAEHVARKLRGYNIRAAELHGKLDQDARIRRLEDFKKGKIRILIATDLASRGLDVQGLPAVVNYDLPRSTADFTHRIGRTGRAGNKGTAVTFVTPSNEAQYDLIETRHLGGSDSSVKREVLPGFEPNEAKWELKRAATTVVVEGIQHSGAGIAHDRMFGGIKGGRKSKKDKVREEAAKAAAKNKK